jgi:hypothetical protein
VSPSGGLGVDGGDETPGCLLPIMDEVGNHLLPLAYVVLSLSSLQFLYLCVAILLIPSKHTSFKKGAKQAKKTQEEDGRDLDAPVSLMHWAMVHVLTCVGFGLSAVAIVALVVGVDLMYGFGLAAPEVIEHLLDGPAYGGLFVVLGVFFMLLSTLCLRGAIGNHYGSLGVFWLLVLIIFLFQMVVAASLWKLAGDLDDYNEATDILRAIYENTNDEVRNRGQKYFECCGYADRYDLLPYRQCLSPDLESVGGYGSYTSSDFVLRNISNPAILQPCDKRSQWQKWAVTPQGQIVLVLDSGANRALEYDPVFETVEVVNYAPASDTQLWKIETGDGRGAAPGMLRTMDHLFCVSASSLQEGSPLRIVATTDCDSTNATFQFLPDAENPKAGLFLAYYSGQCDAAPGGNDEEPSGSGTVPVPCRERFVEAAETLSVPMAAVISAVCVLELLGLIAATYVLCIPNMAPAEEEDPKEPAPPPPPPSRSAQFVQSLHKTLGPVVRIGLLMLHTSFCLFGCMAFAYGWDLYTGLGYVSMPAVGQMFDGKLLGTGLMQFSALIFFSSAVGLFGALKKQKFFMLTYVLFACFVLIISVALVFITRETFAGDLTQVVKDKYDALEPETLTVLQNNLLCCGYWNATDSFSFVNATAYPCPFDLSPDEWMAEHGISACHPLLMEAVRDLELPLLLALTAMCGLLGGIVVLTSYLMFHKKHAHDDELDSAMERLHVNAESYVEALMYTHSVASLVNVTTEAFSRPQRATALLVSVIGEITAAAMFYGQDGNCLCEPDPVTQVAPTVCDTCPPKNPFRVILVGVFSTVVVVPITVAVVSLFMKSNNRMPYETRKEMYNRKRREKALHRQLQTKSEKNSTKQKLLRKFWENYYKVEDVVANIRIVAFGYIPPDDDESAVATRLVRLGIMVDDAAIEAGAKIRAELRFKSLMRTKKRSKVKKLLDYLFPSGVQAPLMTSMTVMACVTLFFGLVGVGFGVELAFDIGDAYRVLFGLRTDIFGRGLGLIMVGLESLAILTAAMAIVALFRVPLPHASNFDYQVWLDRVRVLYRVEKMNFVVNLAVVLLGVAMWHERYQAFWLETVTSILKGLWARASEGERVDTQSALMCCMWEFPTTNSELDMYIKAGVCPEDAFQSCETALMDNFTKMVDIVRVCLFVQFFAISTMVLLTFTYSLAAEIADVEGNKVVKRNRKESTFVKPDKLEAQESEFDTRMRETMAKKIAERDAASDQEEARRIRESLSKRKDFALKRSQSKGSKGSMGKLLGKSAAGGKGVSDKSKLLEDTVVVDQKTLYEKMREKVSEVVRKKLRKMDGVDDEFAEAALIEKRKLKLAKKAPWYTLHLAYTLAFLWVGFCAYFNLLFSLSLGVYVTQEYLTSAATAIISQILISEPIAIFVRTLILPWILGALAGTNIGALAEAAVDIGLGAVTGVGAVSFAERLLFQRRESAAVKAQAALRRVRDRKIYLKLKKEREDAKRQEEELQAKNSLLRAASGVAEAMMDEDDMPVMSGFSVRKAIARKGIKITKKGKHLARVDRVPSVGDQRPTSLRGTGGKDANTTVGSSAINLGPSASSLGSSDVALKGPPRPPRKIRKPMRKPMTTMESLQGEAMPGLSGPAIPMDGSFAASISAVPGLVGPSLVGDSTAQEGVHSNQQLNKMLKRKKKLVRGQGERR